MLTWGEFAKTQPELAEAGQALLCQFGVALAFLATTRAEGAPRVHPIAPQFIDTGFYVFITPLLKRADLLRDGRYALHSYPCADNEDAIYLTGRVRRIDDHEREAPWQAYRDDANRITQGELPSDQVIFELLVESALLTRTTGHGDPAPVHRVWHTP